MSLPITSLNKVGVIERVIDFAETPSQDAQAVEVVKLPPGFIVLAAGAEVLTVEGATAAGTLGTSAAANGLLASLDANAADLSVSNFEMRFLKDGETVIHTTTNALKKAKVRYFVVAVNVSGK